MRLNATDWLKLKYKMYLLKLKILNIWSRNWLSRQYKLIIANKISKSVRYIIFETFVRQNKTTNQDMLIKNKSIFMLKQYIERILVVRAGCKRIMQIVRSSYSVHNMASWKRAYKYIQSILDKRWSFRCRLYQNRMKSFYGKEAVSFDVVISVSIKNEIICVWKVTGFDFGGKVQCFRR